MEYVNGNMKDKNKYLSRKGSVGKLQIGILKKQYFCPDLLNDKIIHASHIVASVSPIFKRAFIQAKKNVYQISLSNEYIDNLYFQILLFCVSKIHNYLIVKLNT